jgi:hypothetical protein
MFFILPDILVSTIYLRLDKAQPRHFKALSIPPLIKVNKLHLPDFQSMQNQSKLNNAWENG